MKPTPVKMEKIKILYVDDEVENLTGFKFVFRKEYKIFLASSAREALEVLENQPENDPIQLVLSDQRMPKMTGVQLLEVVAKKYPKTIRMVVTGYADIDVVMSAINKGGVFRYISKPWEKQDLQEAIDEALLTYRLREENEKLLHDVCESERKMMMLLGNIPGMAYRSYAGDDWKTLFASNGCVELFGYTARSLQRGKSCITNSFCPSSKMKSEQR